MNYFLLILLYFSFQLPLLAVPPSTASAPTVADAYTLTTANISGTSALLIWTGTGPATRFDVRWRRQGSNAWIVSSEIDATRYLLTDLEAGQAYEWQLLPDGSGTWLGGPASFTTVYTCSPPYTYGVSSVSPTGATLLWSSYSAPQTFTVDVRLSGTASWSTTTVANSLAPSTYLLTGLTPSTAYDWRIRYDCSNYSSVSSFTTTVCAASNLASAPLPTQALLRWTGTGSVVYSLLWRQQGGAWTTIGNLTGVSAYNYSLYNLTPNTGYDWQVQWSCGGSVNSSPVQSFTTACSAPTAVSVNSVTAKAVGLTWRSMYRDQGGTVTHLVRYRPQEPANSPWSIPATIYAYNYYPPVPYDFAYTLGGLMPNTAYDIQLQTGCPNSTTSAFSDPPVSTTTSSCTNTATNLYTYGQAFATTSLSWYGPYDNYYAAQYRVTGTTSWSQVGPFSYPGNTSAYLTGLQPGTAYEWRVVTYCTTSLSATTPTATQSFTTAACRTDQLEYRTATTDYNAAFLTWNYRYPSPPYYKVRYRPVNASSYTESPLLTNLSIQLTGLTSNTAYEWQVAVVCDANATAFSYSSPDTFTTTCRQTASALRLSSNRFTAVDLSWDNGYVGSSYPRTYQLRYRPEGGDWITQPITTSSYSPVLSLTGLTTNTVYEWGLARECEAGVSTAFTAGTSFTTSCRNSLNYVNTMYVTAVKATLYFSYNNYAPAYQLRYRPVGASGWNTLTNIYSGFTLSGLSPYTTYEWQVAAQCAEGFLTDFSTSQTFTTDCSVPTGLNSSVYENSAWLNWNYNQNLAGYNLRYRLQGTNAWTVISLGGTNSSYSLSVAPGAYEWALQADCVNGLTSAFSPVRSFTTSCNGPAGLAVSDISSFGARVSWTNSNYSTRPRYNLQWRIVGEATWNEATDIAQAPYTLLNLSNGSTYEVRAQAQCGNAQSAFTFPVTFGATCSAPTALSSASYNYFAEPGRIFYWKTVPGERYTLRWRRIAEGQTPGDWQVLSDLTQSTFVTQFLPGTYEWQVRGVCLNGSQSAFVGGPPFEIPACQTDYITSYISEAQSTSALLRFSLGIVGELRWRAVGAGGWNVVSQTGAYVPITGLTENTVYEWQVRVLCPGNPNTPFGPLQTFTATCGQPTNLTTTCLQTDRATLNWAGPSGSTYRVSWRLSGASTWTDVPVTGTSYALTNLQNGSRYEWQVRPACSPASGTVVAGPVTFTTACLTPTSLTAYAGSTCGEVQARWDANCATSQVVRVRVNYNYWTEYYVNTNYLNLGILPANATVEIQVATNCAGAASGYSNTFYYYVPNCQATPCPVPTQLSQGASATQAFLSWQKPGSGATELRWRPLNGNWTTVSVAGQAYSLVGLVPTTTYIWQVRNACGGPTDWSAAGYFQTTGCAPPFTQIYGLTADSDNIRLFYGPVIDGAAIEARYRTANGAWLTVPVTSAPAHLTGLAANTRYDIQLRTICSGNVASAWSASRFGTTACPVPTNLYADQLGETSARINWQYYLSNQGYGRTLRYRPLGSANWTTANLSNLPPTSPYSYTLTGLSPQTTYEWQVLYDCGSGGTSTPPDQPITFRTTGTAPACVAMTTVQAGSWTDVAVWSCGRLPLASDAVLIRHTVTLPANATPAVQRLQFEAEGQVRYTGGGGLKLGQ